LSKLHVVFVHCVRIHMSASSTHFLGCLSEKALDNSLRAPVKYQSKYLTSLGFS